MLQSDHSRKAAVTERLGQAIPEALQPLGGVPTGDMVPRFRGDFGALEKKIFPWIFDLRVFFVCKGKEPAN